MTLDRQRVQVALTALGFDTGTADGTFGARTREMIASWQKAHGEALTGAPSSQRKPGMGKE